MNFRYSAALAWGSALVLAIAAPLMAQERTGPNQSPPEAAAEIKPSAEAEAVQRIHLAHSLIEYGRKNKAPEALITAARILAAHGTVALDAKKTLEAPSGAAAAEKKDKPASDTSPRALLDEAKQLSRTDPAIVALANSVEILRGAVGGPKHVTEVVQPLSIDVYRIAFRGNEVARVALSGDGDTRLDLYVYDESGIPITSAVGPGDDCLVSWVPRWTGLFVIKVVNRGRVPNRYVMVTN
jgi:hypothetical protein